MRGCVAGGIGDTDTLMGSGKGFVDLEVWQLGRELAKEVYSITREFPSDEAYGLTSQLRRASVSIPANIAEGWGRQSDGSFAHYLKIAKGSLSEVLTLLILANDFGYIDEPTLAKLDRLTDVLGRKLHNFTERLGGRYVKEEGDEYSA